jgi:hypothetical protein
MATKLRAKPPEEVKPGKAKLCVFSLEGGGKTWFALQFPRAYVIDTEGGARLQHYMARLKASGGSYVGPDDGACDFDFIINEVKTLATEKHHYQTLVIDSITKVYQSTIAREAERLGDKDAFGASKKPAIAKMRQLIAWVSKLDMNVVFVAHQIAVWGGEGKDRKQVGVGPDAWEKLAYELDLTLHIEKHSRGFRTATVEKSRLLGFPEFDRFDLQKNGTDVGYENFAARYGKDFIEAEAEPIVLATPEQVAEIERLLGIVKIEQDTLDKWLTKANAETWADLTTEQAAGVLKLLAAKLNGHGDK